MSFLESFVRAYYKPIGPRLERLPQGGWLLRIPVERYVEVEITDREAVSGRLSPKGFLRELAERVRVAVDGAK